MKSIDIIHGDFEAWAKTQPGDDMSLDCTRFGASLVYEDRQTQATWVGYLAASRAAEKVSHPIPSAPEVSTASHVMRDGKLVNVWDAPRFHNHNITTGQPSWELFLARGPAPVLYTGIIDGQPVGRDDIWLATTAQLAKPAPQAPEVGVEPQVRAMAQAVRDAYADCARMAELEDPRTSDWMYDDPHVLAEAMRKRGEEAVKHMDAMAAPTVPRPLSEYHEDMGAVTWWKFPVDEPSYIGSPNCDDWPGYHTHWTPHPTLPKDPTDEDEGSAMAASPDGQGEG